MIQSHFVIITSCQFSFSPIARRSNEIDTWYLVDVSNNRKVLRKAGIQASSSAVESRG